MSLEPKRPSKCLSKKRLRRNSYDSGSVQETLRTGASRACGEVSHRPPVASVCSSRKWQTKQAKSHASLAQRLTKSGADSVICVSLQQVNKTRAPRRSAYTQNDGQAPPTRAGWEGQECLRITTCDPAAQLATKHTLSILLKHGPYSNATHCARTKPRAKMAAGSDAPGPTPARVRGT